MACDPAALIDQAKCINACIPPGMMPAVNTSLLCQIANTASFPAQLLVGLVHYWKMEESSGNNRIDSVGVNNLTERTAAVGSAPGKHLIAADFSGGGLNFLDNLAFVVSPPWSIALWVNSPSFVGGLDIGEVGDGGSTGPFFSVTAAGVLESGNGIDGLVVSQAFGAINVWHLVVFTVVAGGTYSLSVDNAAFATAIAGTPPGPSTKIQFAGSDTSGGNTFNGLMDEAAFWSRALSQADVAELWNAGTGVFL